MKHLLQITQSKHYIKIATLERSVAQAIWGLRKFSCKPSHSMVQKQLMFSSHHGSLTPSMHHHRSI